MFSKIFAGLFGLSLPLFASGLAQAAVSTKSLAVQCTGFGAVTATSHPTYTPGLFHQHPTRAPDLPEVVAFDAEVTVQSLSKDCQLLASKYGINLDGASFVAKASVSQYLPHQSNTPIFDLDLAQEATAAAVGLPVAFTLTQSFLYQVAGDLPLFPVIHDESLALVSSLGVAVSGGHTLLMQLVKPYQVDVSAVYGVTPVANLSDDAKLAAASVVESALVAKLAPGGYQLGYAFETLLLQKLKPTKLELLPAYTAGLINLLDQVAALPWSSSFFSFPVGGAGGAAVGMAVAELSNIPGVVTEETGLALLLNYPELALLWSGPETCFQAGPNALATTLQAAIAAPSLTAIQKTGFGDLTGSIANGYFNILACHPEASEASLKELSAELAATL